MAKVSIKSERITPFGGIFHVREYFSRRNKKMLKNVKFFTHYFFPPHLGLSYVIQ